MHQDNDKDDAEESAFAPKRCKKRSNTFLDSETADSISSLEGSVYGFHESKASKKSSKLQHWKIYRRQRDPKEALLAVCRQDSEIL
jgi:hypothetical protein